MSELTVLKSLYDVPVVRSLFSKLNRRSRKFGFMEALIYARSVDFFVRYQTVLSLLSGSRTVLEVGSGKLGIGTFLDDAYLICLDVSRKIVQTAFGERVIASASNLPFRSGSMDVVVSVDCFEHLPRTIRDSFVSEAKRVGKTVVLHVPVKEFCSETDLKFMCTHKRIFGVYDLAHLQHITYRQPTLEELEGFFPDAVFVFDQNCLVNYLLFVLQKIPVLGWLTGLFYLLLLKRVFCNPPFYGVALKWVH